MTAKHNSDKIIKDIPYSWIGTLKIRKLSMLHELINKCNSIPPKYQNLLFIY